MADGAFAFGLGVGTRNSRDEWLEVFFPQPLISPGEEVVRAAAQCGSDSVLDADRLRDLQRALEAAGESEQAGIAQQLLHNTRAPVVAVLLTEDRPPANVPEAYLKLHLLSHRLVAPHGTNLEGTFAVLPNVAWTSEGAIDPDELPARQLDARLRGEVLEVSCVDKFPKMTNYVVPRGVRIAHTARVRLGAHLGEGTTIMHEGFVNFNAGTDGPGMIEGRISAGVRVGAGSDLGGGCSTIGTLSGRRQYRHLRGQGMPDRCQRRHRYPAGRPLHGGGGPVRHRRDQGQYAGCRGYAGGDDEGAGPGRQIRACCSGATPPPARWSA